jgi:HNH endonuclease
LIAVRHFIMSNIVLVVVCLIIAPFSYYWIEVARRRRRELMFRLKRIVVGEVLFLASTVILTHYAYTILEAVVFGVFFGHSVSMLGVRAHHRDRRIPRYVRQAVIARDLKGEAFDPANHQLDHIVPYSKGGDHSLENVRVLPKQENLRRGARMPQFKDFR